MQRTVIASESGTALAGCPLCISDRLEYVFSVDSVPVSRCADCSLLFSNPHDGQALAVVPKRDDVTTLVQRDVKRLRQVRHLDVLTRILAIVPPLLEPLAMPGVHAISEAQLLDGAVAHETFDACVIVHVLEHSGDPQAVLNAARNMLYDDAPLSVTCSSIDSPAARYFGSHWWGFEPSSRFYFGVNTLQNCMAKAGLGRFLVYQDDEAGRLHSKAPYVVGPLKMLGLRRAVASKRYASRLLQSELSIVALRKKRRERTLLSVIVPVYNERKTFGELIERVLAKTIDNTDIEIIIVESKSTDGTRDDVLALSGHPRVRIILQEHPRGKGNAVRAGLAEATGDIVLFQDADLEYDIQDYDQLIKPISSYKQNFVIGSRHSELGSTWKIRDFNRAPIMAQFFNVGHLLFLGLLNSMYGQRLADPFSMFKVFRRDCLAGLNFECNRFDFDFEIVIKLLRKGYRPVEIPVNYRSRSIQEGKKVTMIRDPLTWIRALFKYRKSALYNSLDVYK